MSVNPFEIAAAQKALTQALFGKIDPHKRSVAENILVETARDEALQGIREQELKQFIKDQELLQDEIEQQKAANRELIKEIESGVTSKGQLVRIETALEKYNPHAPEELRTFTDHQLFHIARKVNECNLDYSNHENICALHTHYIIVERELVERAEEQGKEYNAEKVSEEDLNTCSSKMSDFKPKDARDIQKAATKSPDQEVEIAR